ncbi:sporulation protein [Acidovorax sp. HDW3]|uniref:SPOR domain-containing protein n=1 Tax=Acidovorax sp. HDW3 TaxID=2714923 RepID=UPI0014084DF9|nr:SPOR domain-containing protein [Acidovorax sp. HDW3]QIL43209.1 sporulation protein [Acidovorax sp. HDW3]
MKHTQRGSTIVGFILGLLVGLGAALAVAVYVAKVPVPFLNKAGLRSASQDSAEAERNRNWNPNQALTGTMPARPPQAEAPASTDAKPEAKAEAKTDPKADAKADTKAPAKETATSDPLGDFAKAKTSASPAATTNAEPHEYFVQAGAYNTQGDADAQRAKLAMLGWEAKVSENKKDGRPVFRVRVGPFAKRDDAAGLKEKLDDAGVQTNLVRVQR